MNFWTRSSEVSLSCCVTLTGFALALGPWQPEHPCSQACESLLLIEAQGSCFQPGSRSEYLAPQRFLQGSEQCAVHLSHLVPCPPLFLSSQVWGQQYWEAEGEHRTGAVFTSFSFSSPSSLTLLPSTPLTCSTICWHPYQVWAQCWPWAQSSCQRRRGFWYLWKQTLHNMHSYSVIQLQCVRCWQSGIAPLWWRWDELS